MKKYAGLCLLFVYLLLIVFLSGSPLIKATHLNQFLFSNCSIVGTPVVQAAYTDVSNMLGGREGIDPLRVDVMNNGSLAIYTWQPLWPGSDDYGYENRYFDGFSWGSNLYFSDDFNAYHLYSDYYQDLLYRRDDSIFVAEDIGLGTQVLIDNSIETTWSLLDGACELRQIITYLPGSTSVSKTFTITHTGNQTDPLIDLRFMHGGDIYFGDEAISSFDDASQTITVMNQDITTGGLIELTPDIDSPIDSWHVGWIEDLLDETASGNLSGTVVSNVEDIGVQLQWNRNALAAGETWTINLVENFSADDTETDTTTESSEATTTATTTTAESSETTATTTTAETSGTTATTATAETSGTTTETSGTTAASSETTATEALETTTRVTTAASAMMTTTAAVETNTTPTSSQPVPATGEGGSFQIIAGGVLLWIAMLLWGIKRRRAAARSETRMKRR